MTLPTVVLVDDHEIVRAGTAKFLDGRFDIVGEAENVQEAISVIADQKPDLAVVDYLLPDGTGADVVKAVKATGSKTRFLALSVSAAKEDVAAMLDAGVDGYLIKSTMGDQLPDLVDQALAGARPISPQIAGYMLDIADEIEEEPDKSKGIENLTDREREVVQFMARGYSYRKTAETLFVSTKTIEAHMHNIFGKLGVASRHELSMRAYRSGWVDGED